MTKPISKSKRQLAQLLVEAGVTQFPEGAESAAQCRRDGAISFYGDKPYHDGDCWWGEHLDRNDVSVDVLIPNWHQTVLSREEFDQIVAETVAQSEPDSDGWIEWDGGECPVERGTLLDVKFDDGETMFGAPAGCTGDEFDRHLIDWSGTAYDGSDIVSYRLHKPERVELEPTTTPTLDQLLQDWRNADDYAQRKQTEADEAAAMRDERWQAVQARAGEMSVTVGRCEPVVDEPVTDITDWRDLQVGDVVWWSGNSHFPSGEYTIHHLEDCKYNGSLAIQLDVYDCEQWVDHELEDWRFIRRP